MKYYSGIGQYKTSSKILFNAYRLNLLVVNADFLVVTGTCHTHKKKIVSF